MFVIFIKKHLYITDEYIEIFYSGELVRFTHNEFDMMKSLKPKIINDNQGD